jgi:hypothetical protein
MSKPNPLDVASSTNIQWTLPSNTIIHKIIGFNYEKPPANIPSQEIQHLASTYGYRLIEVYTSFHTPAFTLARRVLSTYENRKTNKGRQFAFDIQVVNDPRPYAICADYRLRLCILIWAGMLAQILEVAVTLIALYESALAKSVVEKRLRFPAGLNYQLVGIYGDDENPNDYLEAVLQDLVDKGWAPLLSYLTNNLLMFVLLHEIHHATDGHAIHLASLIESIDDIDREPQRQTRLLCEFEADIAALHEIGSKFSSDREWFAVAGVNTGYSDKKCVGEGDAGSRTRHPPTLKERFTMLWTGILMLANCWTLSEPFGTVRGTHPLALDRFVNLYWGVQRIRGEPQTRAFMDGCRSAVENCALALAKASDGYAIMAATFADAGRQRYVRMYRRNFKGKVQRFRTTMAGKAFLRS